MNFRIMILIIISIFCSICSAGDIQDLDKKYGFRDMKFEMNVNDIPGLTLIDDDGNTKYYRKIGDSLRVGVAELHEITYGSYKGKLYYISIRVHGSINSDRMLNILSHAYGEPNQSNRYIKRYHWMTSKVYMSHEFNEFNDTSSIVMICLKLNEQKQHDKDIDDAKAAQGL